MSNSCRIDLLSPKRQIIIATWGWRQHHYISHLGDMIRWKVAIVVPRQTRIYWLRNRELCYGHWFEKASSVLSLYIFFFYIQIGKVYFSTRMLTTVCYFIFFFEVAMYYWHRNLCLNFLRFLFRYKNYLIIIFNLNPFLKQPKAFTASFKWSIQINQNN